MASLEVTVWHRQYHNFDGCSYFSPPHFPRRVWLETEYAHPQNMAISTLLVETVSETRVSAGDSHPAEDCAEERRGHPVGLLHGWPPPWNGADVGAAVARRRLTPRLIQLGWRWLEWELMGRMGYIMDIYIYTYVHIMGIYNCVCFFFSLCNWMGVFQHWFMNQWFISIEYHACMQRKRISTRTVSYPGVNSG